MELLEIKFNSKDKIYKSPFGAVRENEKISFCLMCEDGVYIESVKIIYEKEGKFFKEKYFSYDGFYDSYHKFVCEDSFSLAGVYFYYFVIDTQNGEIIGRNNHGELSQDATLGLWQLTVYEKDFETPTWAKGKIMYQIFPDRFCRDMSYQLPKTKSERVIHENWDNVPVFIYDVDKPENYKANDFFCGNIKGIISRLPYLKSLNVGIIYLNPVFESSTNHRYATADYTKIDAYLGTNEDFMSLCKKAEEMGIKIILDGVFSHTGDDSIYFNKYGNYDSLGAYQSEDSIYRKWYKFSDDKNSYHSWWGFDTLPEVVEETPEFTEFITSKKDGIIKLWNDFGISGWRLDVADELPDVFIDNFRKNLKEINPDSLLIGEVWEDATTKESYGIKRRYLLGKQLDSVMNYPFKCAILDFALGKNGEAFINSVTDILENYPKPSIDTLMNFISTHDTTRAITALNNKDVEPKKQGTFKMSRQDYEKAKKKLLLCVFLQFTLPGIPCIYYGDEVGVEGFKDPYNRTTFPKENIDNEILNHHIKLGEIREKFKGSFTAPLNKVYADSNIVAFERGELIFIANNSEKCEFANIRGLTKLYGDKDILTNSYGVLMTPVSFGIFKVKKVQKKGR